MINKVASPLCWPFVTWRLPLCDCCTGRWRQKQPQCGWCPQPRFALWWTSKLPHFWETLQCICLLKAHFKIVFTVYISSRFCTSIRLYAEPIKLWKSIVFTLLACIFHCQSQERYNWVLLHTWDISGIYAFWSGPNRHTSVHMGTHIHTNSERQKQRQRDRQRQRQ